MSDGVFGDLHHHVIARSQCGLDPARFALHSQGIPVDFTGVEDSVAPLPDVYESRFHRWQDVLDFTQVDIADDGLVCAARHEVFDKHPVLENSYLVGAVLMPDDHLAVNGLSACEELSFGD